MSWAIDPKETGSINDGGNRLPLGESIHTITGVSRPVNKKDPSGREQQVVIETTSSGLAYKVYLNPESATESVANIARKTLVGFWQAAGFSESIKPDRLKKLVGKTVELVVEETEGKGANAGKTFTNIKKVNPAEAAEESSEQEEEQEEEPQATDEPEAEEEAPEEKPKGKGKPWIRK